MEIIYIIQIMLLLLTIPPLIACLYMVYKSRAALNGLTRGLSALLVMLIALMVLLSVRRLDDAFNIFNESATLILSSIVALMSISIVLLVTIDLHYLYRNRELFALYQRNRQARIQSLEDMRAQSERIGSMWSN